MPLSLSKSKKNQPYQFWWVWLGYLSLFALSIPWYLEKGSRPQIWLGLPHWVVISLAAVIGVAVFTVFVIHRTWREDEAVSPEAKHE